MIFNFQLRQTFFSCKLCLCLKIITKIFCGIFMIFICFLVFGRGNRHCCQSFPPLIRYNMVETTVLQILQPLGKDYLNTNGVDAITSVQVGREKIIHLLMLEEFFFCSAQTQLNSSSSIICLFDGNAMIPCYEM